MKNTKNTCYYVHCQDRHDESSSAFLMIDSTQMKKMISVHGKIGFGALVLIEDQGPLSGCLAMDFRL